MHLSISGLTESLFLKFKDLFQSESGISLKDYKKYLVEYRLQKFVGPGRPFTNFNEYYTALLQDRTGALRTEFINALTTNFTYFFREEIHFQFVAFYLRRKAPSESYLRFWSAGCSTGEEAYSIALTCLEHDPLLHLKDARILATDISQRVLSFASRGVYHYSKIKGNVRDPQLRKFFSFDPEKKEFHVKDSVKRLVSFKYLNLMDSYPFNKQFDIVFLRNVLIYFDNQEKSLILQKIWDVIKPRGYLILGLSESLVGVPHRFTYLKHSIYRKDQ